MKINDLENDTKPSTRPSTRPRPNPAIPEPSGLQEMADPYAAEESTLIIENIAPQMNVLFLNEATDDAHLMEQKLRSRGIHITSVTDLAEAKEEWDLGVHDLLLVDHAIPIEARLALVKSSEERSRPIPTMMIFETDADQDAVLASKHGVLACVFRDSRHEYISRITTLVESQARRSNLAHTQCLPTDDEDLDVSCIDLAALADEVSGQSVDITPAYLVVLGGPDVGRTVQLDDARCFIGRDASCQLSLTDDAVSRFHASIKQLPNGITEIKDLSSSNGIYLHGKRITAAYLKGGDEVLLGKNTLIKFQR
jgi:DNA-binding response OmpR family regulator